MLPVELSPGKKRVLIVDDDPMVRDSLEMLFEHYGWEVLALESGEMVLQSRNSFEYQLAVVDQLMSGVNGIEVIRELKSISRAPVFMLTGSIDPGVRHAARQVGADGFFSKPVRALDMIRALEQVAAN